MKYPLRIAALLAMFMFPAHAGTIYVDTGGNAANSGTSDNASPDLSGSTIACVTTTCTLDAGTVLTGVVTTPGPTQSAINITGATNANRTIFWITAVSGSGGATPQVTVDVAPTGSPATTWRIGGQYVWPSGTTANVIEGAIGLSTAQDIVQFNQTPATRTSGIYFTARNSGTSSTGLLILRGKTGVRPVLELTGNNVVINVNNQTNFKVENLELKNNGSSSIIANISSGGCWFDNIKISAGGGVGIDASQSVRLTNSELTGLTGNAVVMTQASGSIVGNYIHNNTGIGLSLTSTGPNLVVADNIISANGGRGIYLSGATTNQTHVATIEGNTIANNTGVGLEVADADTVVVLRNNIIANANSADIVKWAAGTAELFSSHGYNVFYSSSTGTLNNVTANGTEYTTSPNFTNAGAGDFSISSSGSAAAHGYPGAPLGSTSVGYRDIGAIQRQVTAGGNAGGKFVQ